MVSNAGGRPVAWHACGCGPGPPSWQAPVGAAGFRHASIPAVQVRTGRHLRPHAGCIHALSPAIFTSSLMFTRSRRVAPHGPALCVFSLVHFPLLHSLLLTMSPDLSCVCPCAQECVQRGPEAAQGHPQLLHPLPGIDTNECTFEGGCSLGISGSFPTSFT
jgi:hypothetical protein